MQSKSCKRARTSSSVPQPQPTPELTAHSAASPRNAGRLNSSRHPSQNPSLSSPAETLGARAGARGKVRPTRKVAMPRTASIQMR